MLVQADKLFPITMDTIIAMLEELYALEAYRTEKQAGLWDFRGCRTEMDFKDMQKVKEYIEAHYDPDWTHKYTALVADKDVLFGLSRMYDSLTSSVPTEVRIFRDFEEAEKWISEQVL